MPGVDRAWVKSLWTPVVRWTEVTEDGFSGGPVMPDDYDGSTAATEAFRANIAHSTSARSLIARDQRSSMIFVPLFDHDRSEEHTSELQSLMRISYPVFCLQK